MMPKINFRYSWIYDQHWKELDITKKRFSYPSEDKIKKYTSEIGVLWGLYEQKILSEMALITTLSWQEENIRCYVVGLCIPFSDPLTVPIYKDRDYFIDVLTHELIHQLFIQNNMATSPSWQFFKNKYQDLSLTTKVHIPIHAIHAHIFLTLFDQRRLDKEIAWAQKNPDYKAAWDIVMKEGYENIIKDFINNLKK